MVIVGNRYGIFGSHSVVDERNNNEFDWDCLFADKKPVGREELFVTGHVNT